MIGKHSADAQVFRDILHTMQTLLPDRDLADLARVFRDLGDQFCGSPHRSPVLSRNKAFLDLTVRGDITWIRLTGPGRKYLLRELYCHCAPDIAWDVFHRWDGDLYYTVLHRPVISNLNRGVYLLGQFQDQQGRTITDLFWLENIERGVVHLCEGDFFPELLHELLSMECKEIALRGGRRGEKDLPTAYTQVLKDAYARLELGIGRGFAPG